MKMQIRRGVFETNSSSVHSITMCTGSDFDRWTDGELLFWEDEKKFGTREEIIEDLKKSTWYYGSFAIQILTGMTRIRFQIFLMMKTLRRLINIFKTIGLRLIGRHTQHQEEKT
ncbi:hypothetical protein DW954_02535 [Clostridium sp. AM45-5]|nr:hypothetical protein [Clostridium sp. AM45-5]RHS68232.1 hypothetical protein DW954_02535 [Clostridium sp. AM45-5]